MKVFFDSSSFAKRFIEHEGSEQVEIICSRASDLGLSVICLPEVLSALNRHLRENRLTLAQYGEVKKRLLENVRDAAVVQLTASVIDSAVRVLETNAVRTMDALHIACALEWKADLFVSSDQRQLRAATGAGLQTQQA